MKSPIRDLQKYRYSGLGCLFVYPLAPSTSTCFTVYPRALASLLTPTAPDIPDIFVSSLPHSLHFTPLPPPILQQRNQMMGLPSTHICDSKIKGTFIVTTNAYLKLLKELKFPIEFQ